MTQKTNKSSGKNSGIANLTPFPPGKSGNPKGKAKGQRSFKTLYRLALNKLAEEEGITPDEKEMMIIKKGMTLAGIDYKFYKDTMDRVHGTAVHNSDNKNETRVVIMPTEVADKLGDMINSNSEEEEDEE